MSDPGYHDLVTAENHIRELEQAGDAACFAAAHAVVSLIGISMGDTQRQLVEELGRAVKRWGGAREAALQLKELALRLQKSVAKTEPSPTACSRCGVVGHIAERCYFQGCVDGGDRCEQGHAYDCPNKDREYLHPALRDGKS